MKKYKTLKQDTLNTNNIIKQKGYYRYINHPDALATTGFPTKDKLLKYTKNIRFDKKTIKTMNERYLFYFPRKTKKKAVVNSSKINTDAFDHYLLRIVDNEPACSLITVPGIYEILAEHYNNEVIELYEKEN